MLIEKKIFDLIGGFDEKFFATFEDVDLGWRSWILGYSSVILFQNQLFIMLEVKL